jgi:hypothetical protein
MRTLPRTFFAIIGCWLATTEAKAQLTNYYPLVPATKLEAFETNIGVVILKASTDVGSIAVDTGDVVIKCREITETSTGHVEQGLGLNIIPRGQGRSALLVDYDEIPALVTAVDYISRLEVTATPLNAFDAAYTTKGGFRVAALGDRRTGVIQFGVRDARTGATPVVFSRDDMTRLAAMINQAKATLDSVRR